MSQQEEIAFPPSQEEEEEKAAWEALNKSIKNMTPEEIAENQEKLFKALTAAKQQGEEYIRQSRARAREVLRENEVFDSRSLIH